MDNSDNCTEIIEKLKLLGSKHSIWSVFEDWLAICAISISNSVDWNHREEREAQYLKIIDKYSHEEQDIFAEAFSELIVALQKEYDINGPTDLLGKIFHNLELHNKYHGQFFTPFNVCELMGQLSLGNVDDKVDDSLAKKGYVSVYEPCVGSGGLVLGFANSMYRKNLNYCKQMVVYCCDIDIKCVYMTYIQLSLYGIPAVVVHGNSLTVEEWSKWYTPVYLLDEWPLREKETNFELYSRQTKNKNILEG